MTCGGGLDLGPKPVGPGRPGLVALSLLAVPLGPGPGQPGPGPGGGGAGVSVQGVADRFDQSGLARTVPAVDADQAVGEFEVGGPVDPVVAQAQSAKVHLPGLLLGRRHLQRAEEEAG